MSDQKYDNKILESRIIEDVEVIMEKWQDDFYLVYQKFHAYDTSSGAFTFLAEDQARVIYDAFVKVQLMRTGFYPAQD